MEIKRGLRKFAGLALIASTVSLTSCETMDNRTQGALIGTAVGALGGAAIAGGSHHGYYGHHDGNGAAGAIAGGLIGAGVGAYMGNQMDKKKYCPGCGNQYRFEESFCKRDGTELLWKQ